MIKFVRPFHFSKPRLEGRENCYLLLNSILFRSFPQGAMGWYVLVAFPGYTNPFHNDRFSNIGITHVFSCINICRVPRMLFEHEADRPSVQHHPRDPASVNAMKQTCVIVILKYFTLFQLNSH